MRRDILVIPEQRCGFFYLHSQLVSFYRDLTSLKSILSKEDLSHFLKLHEQAQNAPKKALPSLKLLHDKYPQLPEIYNLLSYVYVRLHKLKLADKFTLEAYKNCPDHLLTKINYADYCLRKKRLKEVSEVFKNCYDLKELYPSRSTFHVTEFRGFMVVMGLYHLKLNERNKALCYHYLAQSVDPKHSSVLFLQKKLCKKSFFEKIFSVFKI